MDERREPSASDDLTTAQRYGMLCDASRKDDRWRTNEPLEESPGFIGQRAG